MKKLNDIDIAALIVAIDFYLEVSQNSTESDVIYRRILITIKEKLNERKS